MSDINLRCSLPEPYPKVSSADLNKYDTQMLYSLFTNKLNSVSDYLLSSILLGITNPQLADIFECIAISEMKHFKLMGHVLALSGALDKSGVVSLKPTNRKRRDGTHESTANRLIDGAINAEAISISNMKLVNSQIYNDDVKVLLSRIIEDDEHHREILTHLKHRYC